MHIKDLTVHKLDGVELLRDVSFTLNPGDKAAIIGEEGNGKSTILKLLSGDKELHEYFKVEGTIDVKGEKIGYLPQHLPREWEESTPVEFLLKEKPTSAIEFEDYNKLKIIKEIMEEYSIPEELIEKDYQLKYFSGGERVRIQILKILFSGFTILLLDEPTNDLDLEALNFISDLIRRTKEPVLFVSHDEVLLEETANVILHLEQLNLKTKRRFTFYKGDYITYRDERLRLHKKSIVVAAKEKAEYLKKMDRLNDIMNAVHHAQNAVSRGDPSTGRLLKKKMHSVKSMERRFEKESYSKVDHIEESIDVFFNPSKLPPKKIVLDFKMKYLKAGDRVLIEDIDLLITGSDKMVITGPNGSGKTLLLEKIHEELKDRKDLNIGYMPQNYMVKLKGFNSAIEFLEDDYSKEDYTRSRELLGTMKFTREEMENPPEELSDGQKAKLLILKFIKMECNVLILDEPTRNFSPLSAPVIRSILKDFKGTLISVSHDRKFIEEIPDRIFIIEDKKLKELM